MKIYLRLLKDLIRMVFFYFFKRKINKKESLKYYKLYKEHSINKDKSWQYLCVSFSKDSSNKKLFKEIYEKLNSNYFNNKQNFLRIYLCNNIFDINYLLEYCFFFLKKNKYYKKFEPEYHFKEEDNIDNKLIDNSINWLIACQKNSSDRGICTSYDLLKNKLTPSFPETTGYIIPTLLEYSKLKNIDSIYEISLEMGEWIVDITRDDGGLGEAYGFYRPYPRIFTTAQAIMGLLSLYQKNKDKKFIKCAIKMGEFLIKNLNSDGSWNAEYTFLKTTTTYKSRVSWILMLLYETTYEEKFKQASIRSLEYIIQLKTNLYWPVSCTFEQNNNALTHLLGYHLVAIVNFAYYEKLSNNKLSEELKDHCNFFYNKLNDLLFIENELKAQINNKFQNTSSYTCLTGNAQIMYFAILFEKYNKLSDNLLSQKLYNTIYNKQIKNNLDIINGAISGSYPIDGDYMSYMLPSWANKFFIDSLLLKNKEAVDFKFLG